MPKQGSLNCVNVIMTTEQTPTLIVVAAWSADKVSKIDNLMTMYWALADIAGFYKFHLPTYIYA